MGWRANDARGGAPAEGAAVLETSLPLPLLHRGKVRDVYEAGPGELLMVASDRVSAFDVALTVTRSRPGASRTVVTLTGGRGEQAARTSLSSLVTATSGGSRPA